MFFQKVQRAAPCFLRRRRVVTTWITVVVERVLRAGIDLVIINLVVFFHRRNGLIDTLIHARVRMAPPKSPGRIIRRGF